MSCLPDCVTHNFDPERGAFHNLCYLPPSLGEALLDEIRSSGKRKIRADYLQRRLEVEDWLIGERRKKLGPTKLERPIYFFLGDFGDGLDPSRPNSLIMPLSIFPSEVLTFTYPDSMASLPLSLKKEHLAERRPYHGEVFTLDEIKRVVAEFGLPGEGWQRSPAQRFEPFIEVQVWDGTPIKRFLQSL